MNKLLNQDQKNFLLQTARETIKNYLKTGKTLCIQTKDTVLLEKRGAFVTLKKKGELRGCVGYPLPVKPLLDTIVDMAISASSEDFRFKPVKMKEFPDIDIEISVLSVPYKVENISEIEVGKHGIIVSQGLSRGLLLPQVPVEWEWDLKTFLKHGCLKAGLSENAWKKEAEIEIFSAQVFSEKQLI